MLGKGEPKGSRSSIVKISSPRNQHNIPSPRKSQILPILVDNLYNEPRDRRNITPKIIDANNSASWKRIIVVSSAPAKRSLPNIHNRITRMIQQALIVNILLIALSDIFTIDNLDQSIFDNIISY